MEAMDTTSTPTTPLQERVILCIGKTGNGRSTICNVLSETMDFKESPNSVSETKEHKKQEYTIDGIKYVIVDCIGFGDTRLTAQQVFFLIADACFNVRDTGLHQILFVTTGRFTEEEQEVFNLLRSTIFNPEIVKYTTIVKTRYPKFRNPQACQEDLDKILAEGTDEIRSIIQSCNKFIHVNNMCEDEDPVLKARKDSRTLLATHLYNNCREIYKPKELDQLNDKIVNYMTEAQKSKARIDSLQQELKDTTNKNNSTLVELHPELQKIQNEIKAGQESYKKAQEDAARQTAEIIIAREEAQRARDKAKRATEHEIVLIQARRYGGEGRGFCSIQ
ncbi:hypothetical protein CYY_010484 [Polysphondylium violaceum]|uniref:AIG1-type G domain-containing protein n=1 Tax=Polysphondylium violaceum TaxID=133409 RepID=A0A8J4UV15_9MYCE|nr:hypothetical protein CYY_010484 [Polysphondylium violaceum]